jgi:hypothetical protein
MSWSAKAVGRRQKAGEVVQRALAPVKGTGYDPNVPQAVRDAVDAILALFPADAMVEVDTSGHVGAEGGSVRIAVANLANFYDS